MSAEQEKLARLRHWVDNLPLDVVLFYGDPFAPTPRGVFKVDGDKGANPVEITPRLTVKSLHDDAMAACDSGNFGLAAFREAGALHLAVSLKVSPATIVVLSDGLTEIVKRVRDQAARDPQQIPSSVLGIPVVLDHTVPADEVRIRSGEHEVRASGFRDEGGDTTPTKAKQIDAVLEEFGNTIANSSDGCCCDYCLSARSLASALITARATIARLEGEKQNLANDILRCIPADWRRMAHGWEPGHIGNMLAEYVDELRTRADAAERRVEAVMSEAAVEAAAKALQSHEAIPAIKTWERLPDYRRDKYQALARVALAAALAAASGDTATTEG